MKLWRGTAMHKFSDKYHLTPEQSLFLAKKKWDENVYCGMKMENRNITFPQTKTILNGVNVPNVQLDDIQAVLNMRDAWRHLLNTVELPVTLDYMCKLNEYIARNEALEWGKLRTGRVGISGTDYIPPIPDYEASASSLSQVLSLDTTVTDKAISVFLWGARSQLFWDGNKRTSLLLANKILISGGAGMLTINEKNMEEFNTLLVEYYNSGRDEEIKQFLYDSAIHGMEI
ncbi:Fic family protein [Clostridiaceae bacterium OttesenSCG-928-D20]|nr:Fic family protein [Clostridiaceae bacterium OttesenSCG-928-D20]